MVPLAPGAPDRLDQLTGSTSSAILNSSFGESPKGESPKDESLFGEPTTESAVAPRPSNPFQVTRLPSAEEFCNRQKEIGRLRRIWETPGAKLVVYGDRRQGKSAALEIAAGQANAAGRKVVLFSVATAIGVEDAVQRLIRSVHRAIGRSWKTVIQDLATKLRFNITISPSPETGGMPEFTLGLEPGATAPHPGLFTDALDALEVELGRRRLRLGLGIDEFQRLLKWGGENIEWALKAAFEKHTHISYVLAGSATTLIEEMVSNKNRALWKTVETMSMGPIPPEEFSQWIVESARRTGVVLTSAVASRIVALAGPRTRDIILLARATWEDARANRSAGDPDRALANHVAETADLHGRIWGLRTDRERKLLRMLAVNPDVKPTADAVRRRFGLGASSTVTKALGVLLADEVLARMETRFVFDDPFFRAWVAQSTGEDVRPFSAV